MNTLQLYLVTISEDTAGSHDYFVAASCPLEAFVIWRIEERQYLDDNDPQRIVTVFPVPELPEQAVVLGWPHKLSDSFELGFESLGTLSLERTYGITATKENEALP